MFTIACHTITPVALHTCSSDAVSHSGVSTHAPLAMPNSTLSVRLSAPTTMCVTLPSSWPSTHNLMPGSRLTAAFASSQIPEGTDVQHRYLRLPAAADVLLVVAPEVDGCGSATAGVGILRVGLPADGVAVICVLDALMAFAGLGVGVQAEGCTGCLGFTAGA